MSTKYQGKPDEDPLLGQTSAGSSHGKQFTRTTLKDGSISNVHRAAFWKKRARIMQTQITPDNQRNDYFTVRGLMDIEIPGSQVQCPDRAVLQMKVKNTSANNRIYLNAPHTWVEYLEELPNGGSPENTYYSLDLMEWAYDVTPDEARENHALLKTCANEDLECQWATTSASANVDNPFYGSALLIGQNNATPNTALPVPVDIDTSLAYRKRTYMDPTHGLELESTAGAIRNEVTVYIPIKSFLFSGNYYWPQLTVRPRLRFYFNASDSMLSKDTGLNQPAGWESAGDFSGSNPRNFLQTNNFNLILSGMTYHGSGESAMNKIYAGGFSARALTPQRMILNFAASASATHNNPEDTAYQTLTSIQGMFAWLRYYLREQGDETTIGKFHNFYEIIRTTTRDSGGKTIGFEKIPSEIKCFNESIRCDSHFEYMLSQKLNFINYDPSAALVDGPNNNNIFSKPLYEGVARIVTDLYAEDKNLAKIGVVDGAQNYDGNFTLQLSPGYAPYLSSGTVVEPSSKNFTLHIHGWRYSTISQTSGGRFKVVKH